MRAAELAGGLLQGLGALPDPGGRLGARYRGPFARGRETASNARGLDGRGAETVACCTGHAGGAARLHCRHAGQFSRAVERNLERVGEERDEPVAVDGHKRAERWLRELPEIQELQ